MNYTAEQLWDICNKLKPQDTLGILKMLDNIIIDRLALEDKFHELPYSKGAKQTSFETSFTADATTDLFRDDQSFIIKLSTLYKQSTKEKGVWVTLGFALTNTPHFVHKSILFNDYSIDELFNRYSEWFE
jgi:hypothetical protein